MRGRACLALGNALSLSHVFACRKRGMAVMSWVVLAGSRGDPRVRKKDPGSSGVRAMRRAPPHVGTRHKMTEG